MTKRTSMLLGICLLAARAAVPCTCGEVWTITPETMTIYDAVFEGQVLQIRLVERPEFPDKPNRWRASTLHVTFRVSRSWKGVEQPTIDVTTADNDAACGYPFQVQRTYLVFANGDVPDALRVSNCSVTHQLLPHDPALSVLGEPRHEYANAPADEAFHRRQANRP